MIFFQFSIEHVREANRSIVSEMSESSSPKHTQKPQSNRQKPEVAELNEMHRTFDKVKSSNINNRKFDSLASAHRTESDSFIFLARYDSIEEIYYIVYDRNWRLAIQFDWKNLFQWGKTLTVSPNLGQLRHKNSNSPLCVVSDGEQERHVSLSVRNFVAKRS